MNKIAYFGFLFATLISQTGCEQRFLPQVIPTGNPETKAPPKAVPTPRSILSTPAENTVQFLVSEVELGGSLAFKAAGFQPGEELNLTITRPDETQVSYPAYADSYGVLEGTISVEDDRPLGNYTVHITGQTSNYVATGAFIATAPRRTITGRIEKKDDEEKEIRVVAASGQTETLRITGNTTDENGDPLDFDNLNEGDQVKVEYNPRTEEALEVDKLND